MKSWADCSSDEEDYSSDDAAEEEEEQETLEPTALEKLQINSDGDNPLNNNSGGPGIREYDYPNQAPFNAFVGNLSYEISEVSHLQQALVDVVHDRLKEKINIIGAKICYERNSDNRNHRGFGYVELETLEELKIVMKLNDDAKAMLAGRKIQVDTANHQNRQNNRGGGSQQNNNNNNNNRGSFNRSQTGEKNNNSRFGEIDGSKFRGGKFNNNNNNNNSSSNNNDNTNSQRNNSFRGNNTNFNDRQSNDPRERGGSFSRKQYDAKNTSKGGPPSEPPKRPSLMLAKRSKPVDGARTSTSSNIFGGAKARDEQAWEENRRASVKTKEAQQQEKTVAVADKTGSITTNSKVPDDDNKTKKEDNHKQSSGVTGGAGGAGDDSKTTGNIDNKEDNKKADGWVTKDSSITATAAMSIDPVTTNKTKVVNKTSTSNHPERRQSGRGGGRGGNGKARGGGRGSNSGGRINNDKGDPNKRNQKGGSGRRQSQQDKKQDKRRQQPSPEEKAAAAAAADSTNNLTSKKSGIAKTGSQAEPKKEIKTKAPSNGFALLMDSDSD